MNRESAAEYLDSFTTATVQDDKVTGISVPIIPFELLSDAEQSEAVLAAMERLAGKRKDITRKHIDMVLDITRGSSGRSVHLPYDITARRTGDILILEVRGSDELTGMEGSFKQEIFELRGETHFTKNKYTEIVDYDSNEASYASESPKREIPSLLMSKGGRKKLS